MTEKDIENAVRIIFSRRGIKLWKNEPHKKLINGRWQSVRGLGYPPGSPDLIGWQYGSGRVFGVEIKTVNDKLSDKQKKFLNVMVADGCIVYIAKEQKDGDLLLVDWSTGEQEILKKVI